MKCDFEGQEAKMLTGLEIQYIKMVSEAHSLE